MAIARSALLAAVVAAAGLVASPPAGAAETAPAPDPRSGDTWTYRRVDLYTGLELERYALRFLRRDATDLALEVLDRQARRRPTRRTFDLGTCNQAQDIAAAKCGSVYRFPLALGDRSGYSRLPQDGGYGFSNQDCRVAAFERIAVPAGRFDAFRVECEGIWLSGLGQLDYVYQGQLLQTRWYAPSIHGEVKAVVRVYRNRGGLETQELTELVAFAQLDDAGADAAAAALRPAAMVHMAAEFASGTTRFAGRFERDPNNVTVSGEGRVRWANGDSYDGPLVRGAREGRGRFAWANGQAYDGEWHADQPHGAGVMRFPDGQVIEASWVEGQAQGHGIVRFANGDVYEGPLRAGVSEGRGRTSFASGDRYEGEFSAGLPHGRGRYVWTSGVAYDGDWKAGVRHGPGRVTAADGTTTEVVFVEGRGPP